MYCIFCCARGTVEKSLRIADVHEAVLITVTMKVTAGGRCLWMLGKDLGQDDPLWRWSAYTSLTAFSPAHSERERSNTGNQLNRS